MREPSLTHRVLTGRDAWTLPIRCALRACSVAYGLAVKLRNRRYDRGSSVVSLDVSVISVGNITAGGTGKTPLVIEIARRLFDAGRRVAVVSRGYRADRDGLADELLLVSARLLHVVCVQDPDRVAAARRVIADHRIDAIVLDDAFQHRRLARDLDVVTLDATRPFGFDHLLPRGLLREPPSALRRAGLIVITRADQVDGTAMKALRTRVGRLAPGVHCIACRHLVVGLSRMAGDPPSLPELVGCKVVCFSGVGNPVAFERTVAGLGAEVRSHLVFSDHHRYRPADLRRVAARVAQTGAEMALTTEKDAVKLASVAFAWPCPAAAVRVDLDFLNGGSATLQKALDQAIAKHQCP